ncbi:MAG TPA: DUF5668 domain-containing protein [Acidobacteriota bacterium]|nr:DUF5668 domain-containing protein [Acidobacteriota bacterium]
MANNQTQQQIPPKPPPPPASAGHIPTRAALCALVPGVGAVYNREYTKAVVHFSIFAGLAMIGETVGVFVFAAISFYVFTIIDAYRTADSMLRRGGFEAAQNQQEEINLPVWGGLLILMGVLFLLDNLGAIKIRNAVQFWPLILIALGGYLIYNYVQKDQVQKSQASDNQVSPGQGAYYSPQPSSRPVEPGRGGASPDQHQEGSAYGTPPQREPNQGDS